MAPGLRAAKLELHQYRTDATDLAVTGELGEGTAGETRYIRWADLRALPCAKIVLEDEFVHGRQEVTAVFLNDLWDALPHAASADCLLATCQDGYTSLYTRSFQQEFRPFLVLEINGLGPAKWPPPGLKFNPGPFAITVSASVAPAVATLLDAGHKRPWAVTTLEVTTFSAREHDAFSGKWSDLSTRAIAGREIWINSCASCHRGPGNIFGGTKSDRPFEVLAAHAGYNQEYFRKYVRNPQAMIAGAKMEAHPHYTDAQLDALIAFITAEHAH